MSESPQDTPSPEARSAGSLLRAARERQGLHIAALAAAIKVPPNKLDALENGRYDELTDTTFVRALAQSVCRVLKIDAKPILELLPSAGAGMLEKVDKGLKAPFRERPGRSEPVESQIWHQPVFWVVLVLLTAAAGFVLWPSRGQWLPASLMTASGGTATPPQAKAAPSMATRESPKALPRPEVQPIAAVAESAGSGPVVVTETVHSAPPAAASDAAQAMPAGMAVVRATEPSWVEVSDAKGAVLLSRTLQPGESVGLDGAVPLRLVIGNGPATEVLLRGKRVTLAPAGRDNVVRMELR